MLTERNIQVLVASSLRLVGETVQKELCQIQGINATCITGLNMELLTEIEAVEADIVVLLNKEQEVPGVVSHIFDNYPGIAVIVFNPDKKQAILCQRTISKKKLPESNLAELVKQISERDNLNYWGVGHERVS